MSIKHLAPSTNDLLDEEALIKEARVLSRRRRRRGLVVITLFAVACLVVIGIVHDTSSPTRTSASQSDRSAKAMTCPNARVKLLDVSAIPGGSRHGGLIVRTSVASSPACTMSGYPIVGAQLSSHSTAMASDARFGYLGGFANTSAPLPRLSIASRPQVISFTIQMDEGGPIPSTCPSIHSIQITLPGSQETLTAWSISDGGVGVIRGMGDYCGHLFVTPLVKGSSGKGS